LWSERSQDAHLKVSKILPSKKQPVQVSFFVSTATKVIPWNLNFSLLIFFVCFAYVKMTWEESLINILLMIALVVIPIFFMDWLECEERKLH
jgi:hypothetical protein